MSLAAFVLALVALLAAPGPSNTLVGLAGAQRGARRAAALLPALVAGYLCAVVPLAFAGAQLTRDWPALVPAIRLAAAAWVLWLAVGLWRMGPGPGRHGAVTARQVWLTTLLNPKALVVALALLPVPSDAQFAPRLALFAGIAAAVAAGWGWLGKWAGAGTAPAAGRRLVAIQRLAAVWLFAVSAGLTVTTLQT